MLADDVVDALATFPPFAPVPRADLEWLGARGDVHRLAAGATLWEIGSSIDSMWIVLAGRVAAHVPKGGGGSWRKFYDVGPGFVLGAMPYSRIQIAPARVVIED